MDRYHANGLIAVTSAAVGGGTMSAAAEHLLAAAADAKHPTNNSTTTNMQQSLSAMIAAMAATNSPPSLGGNGGGSTPIPSPQSAFALLKRAAAASEAAAVAAAAAGMPMTINGMSQSQQDNSPGAFLPSVTSSASANASPVQQTSSSFDSSASSSSATTIEQFSRLFAANAAAASLDPSAVLAKLQRHLQLETARAAAAATLIPTPSSGSSGGEMAYLSDLQKQFFAAQQQALLNNNNNNNHNQQQQQQQQQQNYQFQHQQHNSEFQPQQHHQQQSLSSNNNNNFVNSATTASALLQLNAVTSSTARQDASHTCASTPVGASSANRAEASSIDAASSVTPLRRIRRRRPKSPRAMKQPGGGGPTMGTNHLRNEQHILTPDDPVIHSPPSLLRQQQQQQLQQQLPPHHHQQQQQHQLQATTMTLGSECGSDDTGSAMSCTAADDYSRRHKACLVCGDHATGYNFNVITCESCKAFFRRNALRPKEFKCPYVDDCQINTVSRRFCQKCRLRKCFQVGMKKEWILNDEQLKRRKNSRLNSLKGGYNSNPSSNVSGGGGAGGQTLDECGAMMKAYDSRRCSTATSSGESTPTANTVSSQGGFTANNGFFSPHRSAELPVVISPPSVQSMTSPPITSTISPTSAMRGGGNRGGGGGGSGIAGVPSPDSPSSQHNLMLPQIDAAEEQQRYDAISSAQLTPNMCSNNVVTAPPSGMNHHSHHQHHQHPPYPTLTASAYATVGDTLPQQPSLHNLHAQSLSRPTQAALPTFHGSTTTTASALPTSLSGSCFTNPTSSGFDMDFDVPQQQQQQRLLQQQQQIPTSSNPLQPPPVDGSAHLPPLNVEALFHRGQPKIALSVEDYQRLLRWNAAGAAAAAAAAAATVAAPQPPSASFNPLQITTTIVGASSIGSKPSPPTQQQQNRSPLVTNFIAPQLPSSSTASQPLLFRNQFDALSAAGSVSGVKPEMASQSVDHQRHRQSVADYAGSQSAHMDSGAVVPSLPSAPPMVSSPSASAASMFGRMAGMFGGGGGSSPGDFAAFGGMGVGMAGMGGMMSMMGGQGSPGEMRQKMKRMEATIHDELTNDLGGSVEDGERQQRASDVEMNYLEEVLCEEPKHNYELNSLEQRELDVVRNAFSCMDEPMDFAGAKTVATLKKTEHNPADILNIMDITMRRFVKAAKKIPGFSDVTQDGRLVLLKAGMIDMLSIRGMSRLDSAKKYFQSPVLGEAKVSLDIFDKLNDNMQKHRFFSMCMTFHEKVRTNPMALNLLCLISLFSRVQLMVEETDRVIVKRHHDIYNNLLKRYVESVYGSEAPVILASVPDAMKKLYASSAIAASMFSGRVKMGETESLPTEFFKMQSSGIGTDEKKSCDADTNGKGAPKSSTTTGAENNESDDVNVVTEDVKTEEDAGEAAASQADETCRMDDDK